jgi:hypothetical protein
VRSLAASVAVSGDVEPIDQISGFLIEQAERRGDPTATQEVRSAIANSLQGFRPDQVANIITAARPIAAVCEGAAGSRAASIHIGPAPIEAGRRQ